MGIKVDPTWKPDSQGIIREVRVQEEIKADTQTCVFDMPCSVGP